MTAIKNCAVQVTGFPTIEAARAYIGALTTLTTDWSLIRDQDTSGSCPPAVNGIPIKELEQIEIPDEQP
jgi:hypothetical protein